MGMAVAAITKGHRFAKFQSCFVAIAIPRVMGNVAEPQMEASET